ncbi:MAG: protein kinase [archaeon]|nr:protein kinase [archaeon]
MAEQLYKSKQFDAAIQRATQEINSNINQEKNYLIIGKCYFKKNDLRRAQSALEMSLSLNTENNAYDAKNMLAQIYNKNKEYGKALDFYNDLDLGSNLSNTPALHNQMCFCLYQLRRYNKAAIEAGTALFYDEDINKTTGRTEKDRYCRLYKLCCLNEMEKYDEALNIIEIELKEYKDKGDKSVTEHRCFALWGAEKYDECESVCKEYLSMDPDLYYFLSLCAFSKKDYEKSLELINNVVNTPSILSDKKHFHKGNILLILGRKEEAKKSFEDCYKSNPKYLEAYVEISKLFIEKGELLKAEELLNIASNQIDEKYQKEGELYFLLMKAEVYYRQNKLREGTALVEYVRSILNNECTENDFSKKRFLKILYKYFELYNLSKGYTENDLIFNTEKSSEIGHGGFGNVYKGKLKGKDVAIKHFKTKVSDDLSFDKLYESMTSVFHELSTMELFKHENILGIYSIIFKEGQDLFLVTPLCKGGNLCELLKNKDINISMRDRVKIGLQVAKALKYMHYNFTPFTYIHHDIKSLNVLLEDTYKCNGNNIVKLCDFGGTRTSRSIRASYTPTWAPPELLMGNSYDHRIDIYSFGIFLWEIFSRKVPFQGLERDEAIRRIEFGERPSLDECDEGTPEIIKELISQCWKDRREERPKDEEIIETLSALL